MTDVTGLVLAAGAGRRFGRPKAAVEIDGERFVDRAVRVLREGGCSPVVIVSGALRLSVPGASEVHNADWESGLASTFRAGLAAVTTDAVVIVPVDTPWLGADSVRRVIAAWVAGAEVATGTYGGKRRHPVLLTRPHFATAASLAEGEQGARPFLSAHPDLVVEVPCDDTGSPFDVDQPEDLAGPGAT
ncbi:nucleotidyltransferase family protein [Tenggerimyces flavus]|uniref:Nucleotidyltransferase family protein n=1 Tax=Tenggerimyces flavus TaxID=1708749 RepID=A0ABV7Y7D9_9ACTN|nr:nucleotidyltransferase family protein [Tenggerimyces flavus]MBM7785404.1 nicotine blue oxidoreductase [Tenggerimyces flavus]